MSVGVFAGLGVGVGGFGVLLGVGVGDAALAGLHLPALPAW